MTLGTFAGFKEALSLTASNGQPVLYGSLCCADDEQEEWEGHSSQAYHPPLFQSQGRPRRGRSRLARSLDDDKWTPEGHGSGHHRRDRPASADDDQAKRWLIWHLLRPQKETSPGFDATYWMA